MKIYSAENVLIGTRFFISVEYDSDRKVRKEKSSSGRLDLIVYF